MIQYPANLPGNELFRKRGAAFGATVLVVLALVAALGPLILPDPALQPNIVAGPQPPSLDHPFGTDNLSRDVLSRVVAGGRISLTIAALAVTLSLLLGASVGLATGYFGGWLDTLVMRAVDGAMAIPRLFVVLLLVAAWDNIGLIPFIVVIGATGWLGVSRLVRAEVLRLKQEPFIDAAESTGAGTLRIIWHHLLPNAAGPLLVAATLGVGNVILLEAGLSFLGVGGVRPPTPSWGNMILDGKAVLPTAPWLSFFPGMAVIATVLSFNLVGEALRDLVDPRGA